MIKVIIICVGVVLVGGVLWFFLGNQPSHNAGKSKQYITQKEANVMDVSMSVIGIISPHHLVAEKLIDEVFAQTAKDNKNIQIDRVVLISPNHFHVRGGDLIVANENIAQGMVVDAQLADELKNKKYAYINNKGFKEEHGILGLVPFVRKYFPDAKIVPLMIEDDTSDKRIDALAHYLSSDEVYGNTLLVLSSDFSHELTPDISDIHDAVAIDTMKSFDFSGVHHLDTDCLGGLRLIMRFAQNKGYKKFTLLANSNSSEIYDHFFIGENTSYVTGQFVLGQEESQRQVVSMLFGGDVMLDRTVRTTAQRLGVPYFTDNIHRIFWAQDVTMVNFEGPVTDKPSISNVTQDNSHHFKFTFDKAQTKAFCDVNRINIVTIGNNHILNFGKDGLNQTQEFLEQNNIDYVGVPEANVKNIVYKNIGGRKIAFVAYNDFAPPSPEETITLVKEAKDNSDFVVVYPHWGREYNKKMTQAQRDTAHLLIDAGADLIVGAHPHVIEPVEIYNGSVIFYSLGNFVFDQFFNDDVRERLLLNVLIDENDKITFVLTPLWTNKFGQLELADSQRREKVLQEISQNSIMSSDMKQQIKAGRFSLKLK